MKRFYKYLSLSTLLVSCSVGIKPARADVFAPVPLGSVAYSNLNTVRNSSWEADTAGAKPAVAKSPQTLTRYEFAIEVAKFAIDFNARRNANPSWLNSIPRGELRALRALVNEFEEELTGFKVDVGGITRVIDDTLRAPAPIVAPANAAKTTASDASSSLRFTSPAAGATLQGFGTPSLNIAADAQPQLGLSLTDKMRLFGSVSAESLLRKSTMRTDMTIADTAEPVVAENAAAAAGADLAITDWLSLRAGYSYNRQLQPLTLRQTMLSRPMLASWLPETGAASGYGGGVAVRIAPSLMLSGGVSRLTLDRWGQGEDLTATQFEGGLGISGLSNRLRLSANLAHLMADDAASLEATAARLNLDFAVSQNLSLNLLYQQMFSPTPQAEGKSTFAGGVNIRF